MESIQHSIFLTARWHRSIFFEVIELSMLCLIYCCGRPVAFSNRTVTYNQIYHSNFTTTLVGLLNLVNWLIVFGY